MLSDKFKASLDAMFSGIIENELAEANKKGELFKNKPRNTSKFVNSLIKKWQSKKIRIIALLEKENNIKNSKKVYNKLTSVLQVDLKEKIKEPNDVSFSNFSAILKQVLQVISDNY